MLHPFWLDNSVGLGAADLDASYFAKAVVVYVGSWPAGVPEPQACVLFLRPPSAWMNFASMALDVIRQAIAGQQKTVLLLGDAGNLALVYLALERSLDPERAISQLRVGLPGFQEASINMVEVKKFIEQARGTTVQHLQSPAPAHFVPQQSGAGSARSSMPQAVPPQMQTRQQVPTHSQPPMPQMTQQIMAAASLPTPPGRLGPAPISLPRTITEADIGLGPQQPDVAVTGQPLPLNSQPGQASQLPMPQADVVVTPPPPPNPVEEAMRLQAAQGQKVAELAAPPAPEVKPGEQVRQLNVVDMAKGMEKTK